MNQKILFETNKFRQKNKKLPVSVLFSDRNKISDLEVIVQSLPKNSAIVIREYDLDKNSREDFAKKAVAIAQKQGLIALLGKDIALAKKVKADGIHFSDLDKLPIKLLKKSGFSKNFIFSFSCHNEKSLIKALKLNMNMIFISPVFPTSSHLNTKSLGLRNLSKMSLKTKNILYHSRGFESAIYALGGINKANISSIRKLNLSGFAAISLFLD